MAKSTLTAKQRRFVAEYSVDSNGTKAAQRAGYSEKTAYSIANELLKKPEIRAAVDAALAKAEEKAVVDKAYVLTALKEVAERCMVRVPVMEFDHAEREMRQKQVFNDDAQKWLGVWEFDSAGANRALELLGKNLKLFTDKVEFPGGVPGSFDVVINVMPR